MSATRVSAAEALRLMREQGWLYLDVRSEQEFELGHPEGAYNVPWQRREGERLVDNARFMPVLRACFALDQRLIVGCERGQRSHDAVQLLQTAGYRTLCELHAGYAGSRDPFGRLLEPGWRAAGLPCASEAAAGRDYAALLARTPAASGR